MRGDCVADGGNERRTRPSTGAAYVRLALPHSGRSAATSLCMTPRCGVACATTLTTDRDSANLAPTRLTSPPIRVSCLVFWGICLRLRRWTTKRWSREGTRGETYRARTPRTCRRTCGAPRAGCSSRRRMSSWDSTGSLRTGTSGCLRGRSASMGLCAGLLLASSG